MPSGVYERTPRATDRLKHTLRTKKTYRSECIQCGGKQFRIRQSVSYIINLETDEVFFEGQRPPYLHCILCSKLNNFKMINKHPILEKLYALVQKIGNSAMGKQTLDWTSGVVESKDYYQIRKEKQSSKSEGKEP